MERRRDESAIASHFRQLSQVAEVPDAPAREYRCRWNGGPYPSEQFDIRTRHPADASQLKDDDRGNARRNHATAHVLRRLPADVRHGADWSAITQIEAERDRSSGLGLADLPKHIEGLQRFQANDDRRCRRYAGARYISRRPDTGIEHYVRAEHGHVADNIVRRSGCFDGVQVGDIDLLQAERVAIDSREGHRIAVDDRSSGFRDRSVRVAKSAPRVDRLAFLEIDNTDEPHGDILLELMITLGWDIGGVNTKVARLDAAGVLTVRSRAFELQRDPDALVRVLCELAADVGVSADVAFTCAVTMTAELSQMFRTKRDGVCFVLDGVEKAFPRADTRVFTVNGRFLQPVEARERPLAVAAANWAATASLVAGRYRTAVLVDVGTTTTDIVPVVDGKVVCAGTNDPDRLASGELVYTGALRTPVEAIVREVPYGDGAAAVSAEGFALIGDVHLWRGGLRPADYTVPTPDGRPATCEFAGERLARVICADRELLDRQGITRIAEAVAAAQVGTIAAAIARVTRRHPAVRTAVVTGLGEFIAAHAARAAGLEPVPLAEEIGDDAARYAPAAAVALLCGGRDRLPPGASTRHGKSGAPPAAAHTTDLVVKVGGGLLAHPEHLDRVLRAMTDLARTLTLLVVPGGGPFADAVRRVDERLGVGDDAGHWMAILGMDQYAYVLASRLPNAVVVSDREQITAARPGGAVPVLAPSRWLSAADPLPHTWDVTSDSIAAWIAGELRPRRLVLVKPPGACGPALVDPYFARTLPPGVTHHCLAVDDAVALFNQLGASAV
jgi:probable H4MPT-linked C1 transfer pathway protein